MEKAADGRRELLDSSFPSRSFCWGTGVTRSRRDRRPQRAAVPAWSACVFLTSRFPGGSLAQNTYTNADKLLEAAEQLAQTGECDPEEIYQAAHQLEDRIQDFVRRVEQRKILLDMSVSFHTHVKEVSGRETDP